MKTAEFDLVVFGATGVVGKLIVEYLAQRAPAAGITWALAARDAARLAAVRDECGAPSGIALLVADVADAASLAALVARTKSVITTVGPYDRYGAALVAACARSGTDYLDLSGEPLFMRRMIDAHAAEAQASGARILFSAGYDSIPSELGVFFLQAAAQQALGHPVARVSMRIRHIEGQFSGGTAETVRVARAEVQRNPAALDLLLNPFALTPGFSGPALPPAPEVAYDPEVASWTAPFIMSSVNVKNVHRSNALQGHPYGPDFTYDERLMLPGVASAEAAAATAAGHPWSRYDAMLSETGPKAGEGPSRAEREAGSCDYLFIGQADDGRQVRASVRCDQDPGYGSTAKIIAETAICLIQQGADIAGGIWTPGAALGQRLVNQLAAHAGLTFAVEGA
jgi:short subunit dehydrogenase-like uncharacterized protein